MAGRHLAAGLLWSDLFFTAKLANQHTGYIIYKVTVESSLSADNNA
jgi:hypothetical protein